MVLSVAACGEDEPTCVPGEVKFTFCDGDDVYECPVGTADQVAAKKEQEETCAMAEDPTKCLLDSSGDLEEVPATHKSACGEDGLVCISSSGAAGTSASCMDPG